MTDQFRISRGLLFVCVIVLLSCTRDAPSTEQARGYIVTNNSMAPNVLTTCEPLSCPLYISTTECLEDYLWNCDGNCMASRLVTIASGTYNLDENEYDPGDCPIGTGLVARIIRFQGESGTNRPLIKFNGLQTYGSTENHAVWFVHPNDGLIAPNLLKNLEIETRSKLGNGIVAGIQFEGCPLDIQNVRFGDLGYATTTHFLGGAGDGTTMDAIVTTSNHEFVWGKLDWCGTGTGCGGPGPVVPDNVVIKNSTLNGPVIVEGGGVGVGITALFTLEDNNLITSLDLKLVDISPGAARADLIRNTFANVPGAKVTVRGGYVVEATDNTTHNGPDICDAYADFRIEGSTLPFDEEPVIVHSWKYLGNQYIADRTSQPTIQNLEATRGVNSCTVSWETCPVVTTAKVYWGTDPENLSNMVQRYPGPKHSVTFNDNVLPCIYYKVESAAVDDLNNVATSATEVSALDLAISNVDKVWNAATCQVDVTWTTNFPASSIVEYSNGSCTDPTIVIGEDDVTIHSVSFDADGFSARQRVYIRVKSENDCNSTTSSCSFVVAGSCF